jgi:hypothetical protein
MSGVEITGGCLCGSVQYRINAAPVLTRTCWCRLCQYIGAGSATVNVGFPADSVTIEGALQDYVSVADSGNVMHRRFCPACGTHLFSAGEARPDLVIVRAGTLDDPELGRPEMTIWAAAAPGWACIDGDIPRFDGPYAPIQPPKGSAPEGHA